MASRQTITTWAVTGSANTFGKSPAIPVTPDAIASTNAALVEKAVDLIEIFGESVAMPNEAREILAL